MALLKNVEKKIWNTELFDVIIRHSDGRDMRGDKDGIPMYDFERMAKNDMTVAEWKAQRFNPKYPGFTVDIVNADGDVVPGNTKLSSVRDSYLEE